MKNDIPATLTISMLISGKKDMRKSLECLLHFKRAISCEVILVDTGCNPEQRRLIERYGDKIIDFAWCDDFAAARNAGLKEAGGEWFLYLDDDEYFENPREIISFFRTGEYKRYHSAAYVVRSYLDAEGRRYTDSCLTRMAELEPETRFEGKIHEYLQPLREPKKLFGDLVHHYGYVYENEAARKAHNSRNIKPLLEMQRRCPGDPKWVVYLAQEYLAMEEYQKAAEICRTGLEEYEKEKGADVKYAGTLCGVVYASLLIALECMESFEEEEIWLNRAMSHPMTKLGVMEPTVAYYCFLGARLYCLTKKYAESRQYLRRYFDYLYKLREDREAVNRGAILVTESVFQPHTVNGTLMCVEGLIRLEDYAFAEEAFYLLDWKDARLLRQDVWEKNILDACCSVPYHPLWVRMLQTLCSRAEGMKEMLVVFLERELTYKADSDDEKLFRLYRIVAELGCEHRYILCTKILWAGRKPDSGLQCQDLFRQLFEKYGGELPEIREEVWDVADKFGISIEPLLLKMDAGLWSEALGRWCRSASSEEIQQWESRVFGWKTREDARYDILKIRCMEGRLIQTLKEAARQQFAAGANQAARDILLQVRQYAPEDREVQELLDQI